jgi:lipopolysaccharide/colanic/teichoic acid biosynthesis glycosyltransferase
MLALCPLFIIIVIAILIEDGYPIFFSQRRALIDGDEGFNLLKFRSMTKDAESRQKELYELNQRSGGLFLLEEDPRLTKVGKFLRSHSLDELPQMISVLKGEMSLVGPRPLSIEDLKTIAPENLLGGYYVRRAKAKPGMTGLWQISGRREVEFREMIMLDLYYIENQSPVFDLEILFATIPVVLFGKGAY